MGAVLAGLFGFLLWSYLKRFEDEASGGPKVAVLTVLHTVEPGAILKEADLGERLIPQAYVESRMIRASDRQKIANLHVWAPLDAQQVLNWTDIVANNEDGRISHLVQYGMRAVTIHTESNSESLVRGGDRVDVIVTLPQPGSSEHRVGVVLLQNVLVLGRRVSANGGHDSGSDVALSLTLANAQILAVAGDKAKVSLALKAPDDARSVENLGEVSSRDLATAPGKPTFFTAPKGPQAIAGGR